MCASVHILVGVTGHAREYFAQQQERGEAVLEQHIATLGLSLDEFVAVVARRGGAQEGTDGERLLKAVESLTNFDVFCDLMKSIDFQHTPAEPP